MLKAILKIAVLNLLVLLCGCGARSTISAKSLLGAQGVSSGGTAGSQAATSITPEMDALACPSDATLVPATLGHAAICIDNTPQAALSHPAAAKACILEGRQLCSAGQLMQAQSLLSASNYWTSDVSSSGTSVTVFFYNIGGTGGFTPVNGPYISLCCSK